MACITENLDIYHVQPGYMVKGEYEIINKIAEGGTGAVYMAQKGPLKTKYAIKFVDLTTPQSDKRAYLQEILLMKDIAHPYISKIIDHEDHQTYFIAIFLYINGPTISKAISVDGPMSEKETVEIAKTLCDIFSYLHHPNESSAIIYCDLKPGNIMLENGIPKLVDFGNSKAIGSDPRAFITLKEGENKGTKGYAAPEQYHVGNRIDRRTDIYGIGATLFNILTGKIGRPDVDGLHPADYAHVSQGLDYIISKCTRINPKDRYQTVEELKRDLDNLAHFNQNYIRMLKKHLMMFFLCIAVCAFSGATIYISFNHIRKESSEAYRAYFNAGEKYEQMKEYDKAQQAYLEAIQASPEQTGAYDKLFYMMLPSKKAAQSTDKIKTAIDTFRSNVDTDDLMADPDLAYDIAQESLGVNDPVYTEYAGEILDALSKTKAYKRGKIDKISVDSMRTIAKISNKPKPDYKALQFTLNNLYQDTNGASLSDTRKANNYYIILTMYNNYPSSLNAKKMNAIALRLEGLIDKNKRNKEFNFSKTIPFYQMMANRNTMMASSEKNQKEKLVDIGKALQWFKKIENTGVALSESDYISKGRLYHTMGNYIESKKAYNIALSKNPNDIEALIQISQTCIDEQKAKGSHDYSEAKGYYDKASQLVTENPNQSNTVVSELSSLKTQLETI